MYLHLLKTLLYLKKSVARFLAQSCKEATICNNVQHKYTFIHHLVLVKKVS